MLVASHNNNSKNNNAAKDTFVNDQISNTEYMNQSKMPIYEFPFPFELVFKYDVSCSQVIGQGGFGIVYSAFSYLENVMVAIKQISKEHTTESDLVYDEILNLQIPKEAYILRRLDHPLFIKVYETFEDENNYYVVMENFGYNWNSQNNHKDLYECILNVRLSEDNARFILNQLIDGLIYLKQFGLYHLDIKDENILIDYNFNVKLIDFGSAHQIPNIYQYPDNDAQFLDKFYGTYEYGAPEVLNNLAYLPEFSDVWSLGTVLHIMAYNGETYPYIVDNTYQQPADKNISYNLRHLLQMMLQVDCNNRPCFEEIQNHPWLKNVQ